MKYRKRILAAVLILSMLAGCLGKKETKTTAVTISKETEWNIKCLNAEKSYEESKSLSRIRVAVLDSGLDTDRHIPFVKRKDFLGESEIHSLYQDQTGHGTSVAGLICADEEDDRMTGIAANVDLYVGRILDVNQQAPVDRVIEAVEWAIAEKVNIIHISFGTKQDSEELEEVIQKAYHQGILIIAAAGNDGNAAEDESTIEYPAAYEEVVSVGATDSDNAVLDSSSTGEELDVVAPGDQILSTGAFGGVVVGSGTSVSAAQVTGIAAVLWGRHPEKSNAFIQGLLVGSANAEAVSGDCGKGLVDYSQSVENYKQMNRAYETYKRKGLSEEAAVSRAEQELPENQKTVASHKGEVNYVNGLWGAGNHKELVDQGEGLGEEDIRIVKAGASLPDQLSKMAKMSLHPCFHGSGNYFANVNYLLSYARQLIKDEKEELPNFSKYLKDESTFKNLEKPEYNIQKELNNCITEFYTACASQALGGQGSSLSTRQKGYAILGLALHTITDTFAHRGYRKDITYEEQYFQIVHNRNEDEVAQLWRSIVASGESSQYDKTYYQYMLDYFACADDSQKMKIRFVLSQKVAKELIAAANGTDDFLTILKTILVNYKTEKTGDTAQIDQAKYFRLANADALWAEVKGGSTKFAINVDAKKIKPDVPQKKELDITIQSKKVTVSFPHKKGYSYQVYYKKGTKKVFFTRSGKKFTTNTKGMKDSKIYIAAFYNSHVTTKSYKIQYTITYRYKKKQKTQTKDFSPKKLSFPLYGNVFKLKKKNFKGWSTKKNAKKAKYKPKEKIKFTGNKKLKLYCVSK